MRKEIVIITILLALVIVGGTLLWQKNNKSTPEGLEINQAGPLVDYIDFGFLPDKLTIKKGATVTFANRGAGPLWVASDQHPTHNNYPGSGIDKCGSEELPGSSLFDSCRNLETNQTFSFTFNQYGIWGYHNHLQPEHTGVIVVE